MPSEIVGHRAGSRTALVALPVVLWAGWPLFERGWASAVNRSLNMFTMIAPGAGAAYGFICVRRISVGGAAALAGSTAFMRAARALKPTAASQISPTWHRMLRSTSSSRQISMRETRCQRRLIMKILDLFARLGPLDHRAA